MNDFIAIDVYAISDVYPNRNNSHFTLMGMKEAVPTFYNKPALGAFDVAKNDFKGHDSELAYDSELEQVYFDYTNGKCEIPLGVIRQSDKVEVVEKDGVNWIHFSCVLWAKYGYRQIKRLLKDGRKKVSVEIEVLKSHTDENGIEIIDSFIFDGFTILGSDVTEAIPNASMTILDKINDAIYQKQEKSLSFAYSQLDEAQARSSVIEKDFSADSVSIENEGTGEITMEIEEKGEEKKLTYEQKRELLERFLKNYYESLQGEDKHYCWVWIADMTDTHIYFQVEDQGYFSAPYSVEVGTEEDGSDTIVNVVMEEAVPVLRSWEEYSNQEENKTVEGSENIEGTPENFEENKGEDDDQGDEDEPENDNDDNDNDDDDDNKDDNDGKEEFAATDVTVDQKLEDHGEQEGEELGSEHVDESLLNEHDTGSIIVGEPSSAAAQTEENEAEKEMGLVFEVGDKQMTSEELFEEYNRITAEFAALQDNYNTLNENYNALNAEVVSKRNDDMYVFACSLVDGEDELTSENAGSIKESMKANCANGTYSTNEEVEVATNHLIADALYAQKKMSKKANAEEFAANLNKPQSTAVNEQVSDSQVLKNAINNLRKI